MSSGVVINKADLNREMAEEIISVAGEYQAEIVGEIPYNRIVTDARMEGLSVVEFSDGAVTASITGNLGETLPAQYPYLTNNALPYMLNKGEI